MTDHQKLRIAIVGGGIGGLALAVALSKLDLENSITVDIYESTVKLTQVGAGIGFFTRSWEIMKNMGLEEVLKTKLPPGSEPPVMDRPRKYLSARKGNQLQGTHIVDLTLLGGSAPFHRADVQSALLENISPSIPIHLLHRLVKCSETKNGVTLEFANGKTTTCDLLIGADGINSVVRKFLLAEGKDWSEEDMIRNTQPLWNGVYAYRYVANAEDIRRECPNNRALSDVTIYFGKNKHVVGFPMRGGEVINLVLMVFNPEQEGTYLHGPAVTQGTADDIISHFDGWEEDVRVLAKHAIEPLRWALQYIKPLDSYISTSGRTILLGDAAHGTAPYFANGAGLAIESAYFLARMIAKGVTNATPQGRVDVPKIAKVYNEIRHPFCNEKAAASRNMGRLYHFRLAEFEQYGDGVDIPKEKITRFARLLEDEWTWTTKSAMQDLEWALSML